ncbi:hypothetical protein [Wohlfahrtiimonas larvae]|uniref:Uncharacterized protein n=1 Tax=Wohlfahrtiimonas larvae TaxID=1157986 RepID=A0ABP9MYF8_9GAMM
MKAFLTKHKKIIINILLLSYPIWGAFLVIALTRFFELLTNIDVFFVVLGAIASPISIVPILSAKSIPLIPKIILTLFYIFIMLWVVVFVGWMSICIFYPRCY